MFGVNPITHRGIMVAPIYFPALNANFRRYLKNLDDETYEPTLNDWLDKYTTSSEYQQDKDKTHIRIAITFLRFLADIGILLETGISEFYWNRLSSKEWIEIHLACSKIARKIQEYKSDYSTRIESDSSDESTFGSEDWPRRRWSVIPT